MKGASPVPEPVKPSSSKGTTTTATAKIQETPDYSRPWYMRGGMHVNVNGMAFNILIPIYLLLQKFTSEEQKLWFTLLAVSIVTSVAMRMKTLYCIVVVPLYMCTLTLSWGLFQQDNYNPLSLFAASIALAVFKVGICMSVCLHRYAAHAAFKCGPLTQLFVTVVGCLANQGGPIWWASQHRCHHKFCDVPRDPHSALLVGEEAAFAFFDFPSHQFVIEEFAPKHQDGPLLRLMDTWSFVFVGMELYLAYLVGGLPLLYVSYSSAWICQSITLWFNVANHPAEQTGSCKSANVRAKPQKMYLPWHFLDLLYPVFADAVGERNHGHHHVHARLAKRSNKDAAYLFVYGLEKLGLIWNVQV